MLTIGKSIGIEIEFSDVSPSTVQNKLSGRDFINRWVVTHDASVESPRMRYDNMILDYSVLDDQNLDANNLRNVTVGGEIVSGILDTTDSRWANEVSQIVDILMLLGESSGTTRDSIHVHVNVGKYPSVSVVQRLLRVWMKMEHYIYRLSGMGFRNRGVTNNFTFMRPLNNPPYILSGNYAYPVFVLEKLLSSTTLDELLVRYGSAIDTSSVRYVPQRYTGINLQKLYTQGSVEFRTANKTLNENNIISWVGFCQAMVDSAFSLPDNILDDFQDVPLGYTGTREDFVQKLDKLFPSLEGTLYLNVIHLYDKSPEIEYTPVPTLTHLSNPRLYYKYSDSYRLPKKQVEVPNRVDIHMLQNELSTLITKKENTGKQEVTRIILDMLDNKIQYIKRLNNIDRIERYPLTAKDTTITIIIVEDIKVIVSYSEKSNQSVYATVKVLSGTKVYNFETVVFQLRILKSGKFINLRDLISQALRNTNVSN